jgi:DNA-binding transcriptional ArsR family regulator
VPRAPATSDAFTAIAEPRRRELLSILAAGPQPVGALVLRLRLPQPAVSKHLAVLRQVGLVAVQRRGRSRLYSLQPQELRPVYDWIKTYERFWSHQLDRIRRRAEAAAARSG